MSSGVEDEVRRDDEVVEVSGELVDNLGKMLRYTPKSDPRS